MKAMIPFLKSVTATSLMVLFLIPGVYSQVPAFPGAEGWGKYTTGGRGGSVYEVTNLNNSGSGSLRDAVSQSGRIVVFRVSGTIHLQSELKIKSNITIAGQTAPGDGICVADYPTKIDGNNVIVRYIRFRLGDVYGLSSSDALDVNDKTDIMIDHCSMTWGVDECFSAYGNNNMTVQYCMVGEGLNYRGHSMGGLWGGYTTYHHNLVYSNGTRHPKYAYTYDQDITDSRNNVIYNWGYQSAYTSPTGRVNLVNNYYKAGPSTSASVDHRIVQAEPTKRMYITGNYVEGYPEITADNWNGGVDPLNGGMPIRYDEAFPVPYPVPEQTAEAAYEEVLAHAGASLPRRDAVDTRIVNDVINGTGAIIDRQSEVGGFPELLSDQAPPDSDHDGMPDEWEDDNGLDKNDPDDRNGDMNGQGYTNLEYYLNSISEYPDFLAGPSAFTAFTLSDTEIRLEWNDNSYSESGFKIERSTDGADYSLIASPAADETSYLDNTASPSTLYYYRLQAYNDSAVSGYAYTTAETFAEGALPGKPTSPMPADQFDYVSIWSVNLSWDPGDYTLEFNVYLGFEPGVLVPVGNNITENSFNIGNLDAGKTYYWRVDAINKFGKTTGDVWTFQTNPYSDPSLVGYWKLNEIEDQTFVSDSSGLENNGIIFDFEPIWMDGKFNGALDFSNNDTEGRIQVPSSQTLDFDINPFSISLWMKAGTPTNAYIIHKGAFAANAETGANGKWYGIEVKDGNFRFAVDDNLTKTQLETTNPQFFTGEWTHVVAIRNTDADKLQLYRDTLLILEVTDQTGGISALEPVLIGNNNNHDGPFKGILDDVRIYNYALSKEKIVELFKFTAPDYSTVGIPLSDESRSVLYPNPSGGNVFIRFRPGSPAVNNVSVYNSSGRLVEVILDRDIPAGEHTLTWHVEKGHHSTGLYFIVVQRGGDKEVLKVSIMR